MRKKLTLLSIMMALITMVSAQTRTDFTVISADGFSLKANGISSDGKYVTGEGTGSGPFMFAWSEDNGVDTWDNGNENFYYNLGGVGAAISLTGRIVGLATGHDVTAPVEFYNPEGPFIEDVQLQLGAYAQLGQEGWTTLPFPVGVSIAYNFGPYAHDITDDGNIIIGAQHPGGEAQRRYAGYWDVTNLADVTFVIIEPDQGPGNLGSDAVSASGDAAVVGGWVAVNGFTQTPTLWIKEGDSYVKTSIKGANGTGLVYGISNNGKHAALMINEAAVYYDIEMEKHYKIFSSKSAALAVSDNGVVVGQTGQASSAFIYTWSAGMKTLKDFLDESEIEYPESFSFRAATGISADGQIVTGWGTLDGKTVSFIVGIPEIEDAGIYPVEHIAISNPDEGIIKIAWEAPETTVATLTGYKVYLGNGALVETLEANVTDHTIENLAIGTYSYYVTALYGEKESLPSPTVSITLSNKVNIPYLEPFDTYALDAIYWDANFYFTGFWGWEIGYSGIPSPCAFFFSPASGEYNEALTSPQINASETENLWLMFNIASLGYSETEFMTIEVYDGSEWREVVTLPATTPEAAFRMEKYDISFAAGINNAQVRFVTYGNAQGADVQWNIDNFEVTDTKNMLSLEAPLTIAAFNNEEDEKITITWADPRGHAKLRYLYTDVWTASTASNNGNPFIAANMYPAEALTAYEGYKITSLSFMAASTLGATYRWFVYQDGQKLYKEDVDYVTNPYIKEWVTVELDEPVAFDASKPLYYGVEIITHDADDTPIATSDLYKATPDGVSWDSVNVVDGLANIYSEDGGQTWGTLPSYWNVDQVGHGADVYPVFCIHATIAEDPEVPAKERFNGYRVLRNGENILMEEYNGVYGTLTPLTTFIDSNPLPKGEEACYEVSVFYNTQEESETIQVCVTRDDVSIDNVRTEAVKVFRNDNNYVIEYPADAKTMTVYNVAGQRIGNYNLNSTGTFILPASDLTSGVYLLRFNEINITTKITKQ